MPANDTLLYIGTYTRQLPHAAGGAEGIYAYRLNADSGELAHVGTTGDITNPAYLALAPGGAALYAVSEIEEYGDERVGLVNAFRRDPASGALTFLNHQSSHGRGPCHLSVDPSGKWLLVANYSSGSIAVYPLQPDGSIGDASATVQHSGSSVNPARQEAPHAHCIFTDPAGQYALVADLGMDKLLVYQLADGQLSYAGRADAKPGAGPRHIAWHPSGRYVFLINELDCTLTAYAWEDGALRETHTLSTLPDDFTGESTCAAVKVSPDGRFVYGSNRGHDSLAVFAFDADSGRLTAAGHTHTQGRTPRDFALDPSGRWLLAANQDTNTLVAFAVDAATGALTPTGQVVEVPCPVCVLFVP